MSDKIEIQPPQAAFPRLRALLKGDTAVPDASTTAADVLPDLFGLDAFERDVLLLAAYAELEPEAAELIASRQGGSAWAAPTLGLALSVLPGASWDAFTPSAALRAERLIELGDAARLTARAISLPESVLLTLLGASDRGADISGIAVPVDPNASMTNARRRVSDAIAASLSKRPTSAVQVCGPDPRGKIAAAAAACDRLGLAPLLVAGHLLPGAPVDAADLARRMHRDLMLVAGAVILDTETAAEPKALTAFAESLEAPLILVTPDALVLPRRPTTRLDLARTPQAEQAELWRGALGPVADKLNGTVELLSSSFALLPEAIQRIGDDLAAKAENPTVDLDRAAWAAARGQSRARMDDLAQRMEGGAEWDDIVLPDAQMRALKAIATQMKHRAKVYTSWGFDRGMTERGFGVSVLFSGPSGAGKTLAAEVLSNALELDLYQIDLSAVVSKWIGETEKNLRRVFDAAEEGSAILLFDEADALFGKRSEVKDSHDRYANIEVSYLLQRLESYRGLAILTTNLRTHIDEAFLRRLRFAIDFPFPGGDERGRIWARAFPAATPVVGLDLARLAQLNVTGGSIRNIAMNAAFLAADRTGAVRMADVLDAARLDYEKAGRALTGSELKGWPV